jgi:hypothetical protein
MILRYVQEPSVYERHTSSENFIAISRQVSPDSLLGVNAGIWQTAQVDESGMTITHMETYNRSENGRSAWDALYESTP